MLCACTSFHIHRTHGWHLLARCASTHLVAVHHEVVCGDERFEDHDPAAAAAALQQRVGQVGDADVQLIGAVDQIWRGREREKQGHMVSAEQQPSNQEEVHLKSH